MRALTRWLAIDFGERRIGLAMSDPEGRIALPLDTLERRDDRSAARAIGRLVEAQGVGGLILGEPRHLDGSRSEAGDRIERFAERLERTTGLTVTRIDEALTSHEAEGRLRDAGVDVRRHPERIDAVAAQILLEEHLSAIRSTTRRRTKRGGSST